MGLPSYLPSSNDFTLRGDVHVLYAARCRRCDIRKRRPATSVRGFPQGTCGAVTADCPQSRHCQKIAKKFREVSPIQSLNKSFAECFRSLPVCQARGNQRMQKRPVVEHKGNATHLSAHWILRDARSVSSSAHSLNPFVHICARRLSCHRPVIFAPTE